MAGSALRRRKKGRQNVRWRAMTPSERVARAARIVVAGRKLRAAALKTIGFTHAEIRALDRSSGR